MLENIEEQEEYTRAANAFEIVLENARKAEEAGEPLE